MTKFEQLGKKLDKLANKLASRTEEGIGKAGNELKEWGKGLDELGERIKKMTQEGVDKISSEAKGMVQTNKLRSEIKDRERDIESLTQQLGAKTYQLHLQGKITHVKLKELGGRITRMKKDIEAKEKEISRLKEKEK